MSSGLHRNFRTDVTKEQTGVPIQYAPNDDGTIPTFTIRRRGPANQQYAKELRRESQPFERQIQLGTVDHMVSSQILVRVFCAAILVGWENIQDETGKPIAFSKENAIKLLTELPDLFDDLQRHSENIANFRAETTEQATKN